jgi:glycosyltransferase involved in cell wall biosynthesis
MRKLLLITPFFPPSAASGAFRTLGFAKHLPSCGWELTVVASGPRPWEANDPELISQVPCETQVHYVDFPLHTARRLHHQLLQHLKVKCCTDVWNAPTLKQSQETIEKERPDVILTSGPPHNVHRIGRTLQKLYGIPWVADFRDPWCSWGKETPYLSNNFVLDRYLERSVFRHANLIVANTENTAKMFKSVFPGAAKRIEAVPNGFDPVLRPYRRRVDNVQQRCTLLHTGEVYAGRDPTPIAEALRLISQQDQLSNRNPILRLLGRCDTTIRKELEPLSLWIEMTDQVSYNEVLAAMEAADVLVLLDSPGRRIGVPAKLYEYMRAQRPILAVAEQASDTALILAKSGLPYRVVSYREENDVFQEAIQSLLADRQTSNPTTNGSCLEQFTRAATARQLATILNVLC